MKINKYYIKRAVVIILILIISCGCFFFADFWTWIHYMPYRTLPTENDAFFAGHRVLIVVPHQDDDANLAQGLIEKYVDCGSEVFIIFTTNGDHADKAYKRMKEAIDAESFNEVSSDHLIFLGYGNDWDAEKSGYGHIYDAPPGKIMTSAEGFTETYGSEYAEDFHSMQTGSPAKYTRQNMLQDIIDSILYVNADTIYAIDMDEHPDHRACSLLFEEAMENILKRPENEYFPRVYKGFGYCTGWDAKKDYISRVMLSTPNPADRPHYLYNDYNDGSDDYMPHIRAYNWSDRARFPVAPRSLAWSMRSSTAYKAISCYKSQIAIINFEKIVNGDRVFWERPTDSLSYRAKVTASSGRAELLNDFKIYDNHTVMVNDTISNNEGVWIPDEEDNEKSFEMDLGSIFEIERIVFYDNDSLRDNIKDIEIYLDGRVSSDGFSPLHSGALRINGAPTEVDIRDRLGNGETLKTDKIVFRLAECEGTGCGLTEVEVYGRPVKGTDDSMSQSQVSEDSMGQSWVSESGMGQGQGSERFIKITDPDGNFLYDMLYQREDQLCFKIYDYSPVGVSKNKIKMDVTLDGETIISGLERDEFEIPNDFKPHELRVSCRDSDGLGDSIYLRPMGFREKFMIPLVQKYEKKRMNKLKKRLRSQK